MLKFLAVAGASGFLAVPQQHHARPQRPVVVEAGKTPEEFTAMLEGERMILRFQCYGFYGADCLLTFNENKVNFSAGMVSIGAEIKFKFRYSATSFCIF